MPRIRKAAQEAGRKDKPPEVARYLEDGHPNPKAMTVWEFMQELTEDQWSEYVGYLYRVQPRKQPTDRAAYIAVISSPITLEDVKRLYGGQKFTLHFNRRVGKRQNGIYTVQFDIEAVEIPQDGEVFEKPVGPGQPSPTAVGGDPNNMVVLTNLIRDLVAQNTVAQAEGRPFDPTAAITEALKIQSQGATAAIDMIAKNKGGGGKENSQFQEDILKRLLDKALDPPQKTSTIDEIKAILELSKELRPETGGGDGGTNNVWVALAQNVGPKLDVVIDRLANIVQNWAIVATSKNPAMQAAIQKANAAATATPAAPAVEGATPAANPQPTQEQIDQFRRSVITEHLKKTIIQMLFAGEQGDMAAEIAEKMDAEWAKEFAKTLRDNIASLASDPILGPAVSSPRLPDFAAEFLGYFEEEPPAEPAAEAPAAPQAS